MPTDVANTKQGFTPFPKKVGVGMLTVTGLREVREGQYTADIHSLRAYLQKTPTEEEKRNSLRTKVLSAGRILGGEDSSKPVHGDTNG